MDWTNIPLVVSVVCFVLVTQVTSMSPIDSSLNWLFADEGKTTVSRSTHSHQCVEIPATSHGAQDYCIRLDCKQGYRRAGDSVGCRICTNVTKIAQEQLLFNAKEPFNIVKSDDIICSNCMMITKVVKTFVSKLTVEEFKTKLNDVCKIITFWESQCVELVEKYARLIYVALNYLEAENICKMIGFCSSNLSHIYGNINLWASLRTAFVTCKTISASCKQNE